MKKLILSAAFFAFAGVASVQASNIPASIQIVVQDSVIKTPIKLEELPDAVKNALQSEPYKDWTPTAAFSVKDGDKSYFQVDVRKEEETSSLKFTADGKPVE